MDQVSPSLTKLLFAEVWNGEITINELRRRAVMPPLVTMGDTIIVIENGDVVGIRESDGPTRKVAPYSDEVVDRWLAAQREEGIPEGTESSTRSAKVLNPSEN